jgi:hypothetical protein
MVSVDAGTDTLNRGGTGLISGTGGTGAKPLIDGGMNPPPVVNTAAVKLVSGRARLVGAGTSSCTNQVPAPGDRWCAFFRDGANLGRTDLWVINVSKADALRASGGAPIVCNGMDPNCIRLTDNLWNGTPDVGPTHPFAHGFDGDTLIYHADPVSAPDELYEGFIYAWRPGWTQARKITTNTAITCAGNLTAPVAYCLQNISKDDTQPVEFDIHAGTMSDSDATTLPKVDRIHPLNSKDVTKWRASFNRAGTVFAYSTGRTDLDLENMWTIPVASLGTFNPNAVPPVLSDASRFTISRDGTKVYYFKGFNYSDAGAPSGTLMVADFPSGANPRQLITEVGAYLIVADDNDMDKGVAYFHMVSSGKGNLRIVNDISKPDDYLVIGSEMVSALLSPDLRYTFYATTVNEQVGTTNAFVVDNTKARKDSLPIPCSLQREPKTDYYGTPFLKNSGLVFWVDDVDPNLFVGQGWLAKPDCSGKRQFAQNIDFWFPVGDEGLIYSDDTGETTTTIRNALIGDGVLATGTQIQKQANRLYGLTLPDYDILLYQIADGYPESDGIYLWPLPYGRPVTADGGVDGGVDGGDPDASADASL